MARVFYADYRFNELPKHKKKTKIRIGDYTLGKRAMYFQMKNHEKWYVNFTKKKLNTRPCEMK